MTTRVQTNKGHSKFCACDLCVGRMGANFAKPKKASLKPVGKMTLPLGTSDPSVGHV